MRVAFRQPLTRVACLQPRAPAPVCQRPLTQLDCLRLRTPAAFRPRPMLVACRRLLQLLPRLGLTHCRLRLMQACPRLPLRQRLPMPFLPHRMRPVPRLLAARLPFKNSKAPDERPAEKWRAFSFAWVIGQKALCLTLPPSLQRL